MKITPLSLWLLFLLTRFIIWIFPPNFSDVFYSYRDYARLWNEGYTPYLKHLFEYPPANIPLFYFPKITEQLGILNYRTTYRLIVLLVDLLIFSLLIKTLKKLKLPEKQTYWALTYYILATFKAKDFVYDSMDLIFIAGLFLFLVLPKLKKPTFSFRFLSWFLFWLSTAFKYITFPLAIPYLLMKKGKEFKSEVAIGFLTFLIIWGLPLAIFRSSLSVSFVYHFKRGFQVESVPANIIRLIDSWTKSEKYIEVFKNYDITGPVTKRLTPVLSLLSPITLFAFLLYSIKKALSLVKKLTIDEYQEKLRFALNYIFLFLLTSKVFSTPFHLWIPPLLTIYPFKSLKKQLTVFIVSFFMITVSMSPIPNLKFFIFDLHTAIGISRPICLLSMLYLLNKS